jgi:protein PhnA
MSETELPPCPTCASVYTYESQGLLVCPECAHEWMPGSADGSGDGGGDAPRVVTDSVGTVLADGDTVTIVKDLKVKGSATAIKVGTKVQRIRLVDGPDGHDIDAKVPGFGSMMLKSSVVKKSN